jgi:hypothetical protein
MMGGKVMAQQRDELQGERLRLDRGGSRGWLIPGVIGLLGLAAAAVMATSSPEGRTDFFHSYLANFMYFLSLALGGLFFVLISHLTRAGWNVTVRRLAEVVAWAVVPLAVLAVVILFGMHDLYEWSHAEVLAHDELLQKKQAWLDPTFFAIRLAIYFLVWGLLATYFLRQSRKQDESGDPSLTTRMERVAAPGMIAYALTVTFAAFDLLMSLTPHWYSTIYGVYYFAGCILGFFAQAPVLIAMLKRRGFLTRLITPEHSHDLGKLMFGFVVFWAYIAFSQYLLIWYGNLPEETVWYSAREQGVWVWISVVLLFGHFILPFLWLMSRYPKRKTATLLVGAVWLLIMHWVDVFYLVMPNARPDGVPFRLMDLACFVGIGGLFLAVVIWRLGRTNLIPVNDPRLDEALSFENA